MERAQGRREGRSSTKAKVWAVGAWERQLTDSPAQPSSAAQAICMSREEEGMGAKGRHRATKRTLNLAMVLEQEI